MAHRKLRPVIDGEYRLIGPSPDLAMLPGDAERRLDFEQGRVAEYNAPVDHHIFQSADGHWHLWGCVRATSVGRVLYHWETTDFFATPWRATGEFIRADRSAGECVDDWNGEEWLQSPYVVRHDGTFYMFYGGHRSGVDRSGRRAAGGPARSGPTDELIRDERNLFQMCLMTSTDGRSWSRHRSDAPGPAAGTSSVFMDVGETRNPCVIQVDGLWLMYYAGFFDPDRPEDGAGFLVRRSRDLIHWSGAELVHRDPRFGAGRVETECPHVVYRDGFYYLFRTVNYYRCLTYVFRSDDPTDFGIGDASTKLVGRLPCAAPEVYRVGDAEFVSSSHQPLFGESICRLRWVEE